RPYPAAPREVCPGAGSDDAFDRLDDDAALARRPLDDALVPGAPPEEGAGDRRPVVDDVLLDAVPGPEDAVGLTLPAVEVAEDDLGARGADPVREVLVLDQPRHAQLARHRLGAAGQVALLLHRGLPLGVLAEVPVGRGRLDRLRVERDALVDEHAVLLLLPRIAVRRHVDVLVVLPERPLRAARDVRVLAGDDAQDRVGDLLREVRPAALRDAEERSERVAVDVVEAPQEQRAPSDEEARGARLDPRQARVALRPLREEA